MSSRARTPSVASDGALLAHSGKYARNAVMLAFEMIGGTERLAEWANDNPGEFYTKLFSKTITRETDHNVNVGIEDALEHLDALEAEEGDNGVFTVMRDDAS